MANKFLPALCLFALAALAGCSSHGGRVTLTSRQTGNSLVQSFNQAYVAQTASGEYDIVLLDSAADWEYDQPAAKRHRPLQAQTLAPLRQVMRIHLYWRPITMTTRNPAAINASIDWFVFGADGGSNVLVYEGAGYVTIDDSGTKRDVVIRDGQINLKKARGSMQDPVGPSTIGGNLTARVQPARVKDTLAQIDTLGK